MTAAAAAPPALEELARAWGVETSFRDVDGHERVAAPDSLVAVLHALGAPVERIADAPAALAARRARVDVDLIAPVTVARPDAPAALRLDGHAGRDVSAAGVEVQLETGEARAWSVPVLPAPGRVVLPERLPIGAHDVTVALGARRASCTLLVAPPQAPPASPARSWGVFAPLYALQATPGAAPAFGDLERLARWAGDRGAEVVGTLPLLACLLDDPAGSSPYAPASRRLWNEAFIDLHLVPELDGPAADLPADDGRLVDLAGVLAAKRPALETAVRRLYERAGDRLAALRRFVDRHPEVGTYARFRAARERHGGDWHTWPSAWRPARIPDAAVDEDVCRYHEYVQWVAEDQLAAVTGALRDRGQRLYLDFPVGTHPLGFDVWSEPGTFADGVTVGAPPDTFFGGGQNWGFPPLHPGATRAGGHAYLRACLRHHFRHAGVLRIDHVMGLHRLYWIPEGAAATDGVYVRYPAGELYAALVLEAARTGSRVVGENLGTVPDEVQEELRRRRIATMHVVEFELDPTGSDVLRTPPPGSVATLDTHDTPTFAAFWRDVGAGVRAAVCEALVARGRLDPDDAGEPVAVLGALLGELGSSDAELVMVALEDLWLETEPQNVPGTTIEHPNWSRRLAHRLDELPQLDGVDRLLDRLGAARQASNDPAAAKNRGAGGRMPARC